VNHALFALRARYDKPLWRYRCWWNTASGGSTAAAPSARDVMLQSDLWPPWTLTTADRGRIAEQQKAPCGDSSPKRISAGKDQA